MRKKSRSVGWAGAAALVSAALLSPPAAADTTAMSFTLLATNPTAAAQPTARGKTIQDLAVKDGLLYTGYGDYDANTGPISVSAMDLATGAFTSLLSAPTEEINVYREISGNLYAPQIDPRLPWTADVGYATDASGSWTTKNVTPFIHVFDVASSDGSGLWLAGSISDPTGTKGDGAALKRSTDGGATWTIAKRTTSSPAPNDFDRNYWVASAGGKIYAKPAIITPTPGTTTPIDVWNNGTWTTIPDPQNLVLASASAKQVAVLGGKVVFPSGAYIDSSTDSIGQGDTGLGWVLDFAVDGSTLYALSHSGIARSTDGVTWTLLNVSLPPAAGISCIAVGQGTVYLGGAGGKIYSALVPA